MTTPSSPIRLVSSLISLLLVCGGWVNAARCQEPSSSPDIAGLRAMTWNIWHGGREDGEEIGPQLVIRVMQDSGADLIAMQETYGSGERISQALGFHFQPRGTNVSILSRYPILEDISVFEAFKCVGALVELPNQQRVAFYSIWLPYAEDIWLPGVRDQATEESWVAACAPSAQDLASIRDAIEKRLQDDKYDDVTTIIAGDFNSMSHLDYSPAAVDQFGRVMDWATSHEMIDHGFRDAYREWHPVIDRQQDATWSPRFGEQEQDRIDFVYYRSKSLRASSAQIIRDHDPGFPSDHAAVVVDFSAATADESETTLRTVSYNIRRGWGTDGVTDLGRSAKILKDLRPDLIGLQEVDFDANRSGRVNQVMELAKELEMHPAFGPFMDFQGGQYGLAVLSRFPFRKVHVVKLPEGNEPRVALAAEVVLPDDQVIVLVNLHFDWVRDDGFRFQQAQALREFLDHLELPYVLVGDFNDQRGSRTLELLSSGAIDAEKPAEDRFTYSSTDPQIEIDFVFASPAARWRVGSTQVIDAPLASDHRPVFAELTLREPPLDDDEQQRD